MRFACPANRFGGSDKGTYPVTTRRRGGLALSNVFEKRRFNGLRTESSCTWEFAMWDAARGSASLSWSCGGSPHTTEKRAIPR